MSASANNMMAYVPCIARLQENAVESLRNLYRSGEGPSSSHTMGPRRASLMFREMHPEATSFRVTLYASLAATGKGHLTDVAITEAFAPHPVEIVWKPGEQLPRHPNAMRFEAISSTGEVTAQWVAYSVGGGRILCDGDTAESPEPVYELHKMEDLLAWAADAGKPLWAYVEACEDDGIWDFLAETWQAMQAAIEKGLHGDGCLPGSLRLARKAGSYWRKVRRNDPVWQRTGLLAAYALAAAEENAGGGLTVTAPTCGSCGVLPAVLRYVSETIASTRQEILRALATAGLIGNLVKTNASIAGAEVGCQGEVGVACAMTAGAAAQLLGASPRQIEYAAEMGLEHHLGLTCDPVGGLVQIPCIERNALAATRALDCAEYAMLSDGTHRITFDEVVEAMRQTGHDLPSLYRETSEGGLAKVHRPPAE